MPAPQASVRSSVEFFSCQATQELAPPREVCITSTILAASRLRVPNDPTLPRKPKSSVSASGSCPDLREASGSGKTGAAARTKSYRSVLAAVVQIDGLADSKDSPLPDDAENRGDRKDSEERHSGPNADDLASENRSVESRPAQVPSWGALLILLLWGFLVLAVADGDLGDVTNLWWLILVFGAAVPMVLVAQQNRSSGAGRKRSARKVGRADKSSGSARVC
jgi:hypothetical protein